MTPALFLLCVLAAVTELDTTYAFQLTFSRGIIIAPLFSLLTGDVMAGIQVGVFTELLFADVNPLGGILPPSAVICSAVTLALHYTGTELYLAFIFGVIVSILFAIAEKYRRRLRFRWLVYWEQKITQKPERVNQAVAVSLLSSAAINFVLLFAVIGIGTYAVGWLSSVLPEQTKTACKLAYMAVPWIGLTALIPEFRLKTR